MTAPGLLPRIQAAIGLASLAGFAAAAIWARFEPPYMDDWDWLLFTFTGPGGLAGLLQPHNEHVIPLARLLTMAQRVTGGIDGHLTQWVALGCHLATAAVCWREVGRRWPDQAARRLGVGGLVLVMLGSTLQLQSVVFAASVLFPLVQLFGTLAIVALLHATEPHASRRVWWWAAAAACVAGALASTTSGLAVPFVLAGLAWLRGASWRVSAAWTAAGAACAAIYAMYVGPGGAAGGGAGPAALVAYALAVLAAGLSYVHAGLAVVAGGVVAAAVVAAATIAARRRSTATRLEAFALGVMAFGMASVLMVTPGRAQFGVEQAGQSRYATFVVALLAALVLYGASRLDRAAWTRRARRRLAAAALTASLLCIGPNVYVALLWRAKADVVDLAYLSVRAGAPDPVWLQTLHPRPDVVTRVVALAAASGDPAVDARLGQIVADAVPSAACGGAGRLVRGSGGGWQLAGVWPASLRHAVIVDGDGRVSGLARPAPWVTDPDPPLGVVDDAVRRRVTGLFRGRPSDREWRGFARPEGRPPYRWVAGDTQGHWSCSDVLDATGARP